MESRFLVFVIVILPILSVCLGFTVHYAIRPMVESLIDALHELGRLSSGGDSVRVERLEAEVDALRAEVRGLRDARDFDREVGAGEERKRLSGRSARSLG
jgi:hypothetical protein